MKLLVTILALSLSVCGNAQLVSIDWQNCYGGSGVDANATVRYTTDGGFLLIGRTESNDSNVTGNHGLSDVWATKLDSAGNLLWQRALGGTANDLGISVQETNTGYVIAGQTMSNDGDVNGYHGGIDGWIVKLDLSGTLVWQKCLGGSGYDILRSIRHTVDGGFIAAGWSASSDGDLTDNNGLNDYWLVKLDSAGAIEWQKSFGGTGNDEAYNIDQTTDGGFVLAGR
ncbi:MAG TPA: hypothetical protein VEY71_07395, partial [Chitinophagales bacterium]|nr:hypothetical protein [Chitinophagales bacterium]